MQKKSLFAVFTFLLGTFVLPSACKKSENCTTENMSYKNDITPILKDNGCLNATCHDAGGSGGSYVTYAGFKAAVDANRVLGAIKHEAGFSKMPKDGKKISDCDISQIEAWIKQGAKDN